MEQERHMRHLRDLDHIRRARLDDVLNREQFAQAPPLLRAQAPVYREYTKEEICPENVRFVTTLQLLRCRARTLCAQAKRMFDCTVDEKPRPFVFNSPERFGDCAAGREESLRRYIARQVRNLEEFRTRLERVPGA